MSLTPQVSNTTCKQKLYIKHVMKRYLLEDRQWIVYGRTGSETVKEYYEFL